MLDLKKVLDYACWTQEKCWIKLVGFKKGCWMKLFGLKKKKKHWIKLVLLGRSVYLHPGAEDAKKQ